MTAIRKRSRSELKRDRKRVAELSLQGYSIREIAEIMFYETGYKVSPSQIQSDLTVVRKEWKDESVASYDQLMNQELARIDALERELWNVYRQSLNGAQRTTVEKVARALDGAGDDEDINLLVARVTEVSEPDTKILNQIHNIQKERRKLLGLYAPARLGINMSQTIVEVKGYAPIASPDNWPSLEEGAIDGEYEE